MTRVSRALLVLAWTIAACLTAATVVAQSLEVVELKHRRADEVIPVLQPLLEPGGAITGQDYKLFVRTSKANLAQLRSVLAQIDMQARQLTVSVRQDARRDLEREGASVSGTVRAGNGAVAVNERARDRSGVTVRGTDSTRRTQGESVSSVQVIEGNAAFIATGSSIPIVTAVAGGGGRRPWAATSLDYRNLSSGFMVTPRVNGEQVVLDIEQRSEQLNGGRIETQQLTTQIGGRLGEWIELGGISESSSSTRSGILERQYTTSSDARSLWVRVEAQ